jgi:TolB-like protein
VKSIAVLPFADLGAGANPDSTGGFFARGIHEDILTHLARLSDLKVISRTSVLAYADGRTSGREIGRSLGVAHLLLGSVRRSGERVRVSAQLIETGSEEQLWADSFDAELRDVFSVQSRIARRIAEALQSELSSETASSFDRVPTTDPAAYDAYLQARDVHRNLDAEDDAALERAGALYQRALEIDPHFAEAWAQLAILRSQQVWFGAETGADRKASARSALDQARAVAPDLPMLALAEGIYAYYCERDYTRALLQFGAALERSPGDAEAIFHRAMILRRMGSWDDAIRDQRRALELDPLNLGYQDEIALTLALAGRLEEADALLATILAKDPARIRARFYAWQLGLELRGDPDRVLDEILASDRSSWGFQHYLLLETVATLAGREQEAIEVIASRPMPQPDSGYRDFQLANLYASSGRSEQSAALLERSWREYQRVLAERPNALPAERRDQIEAFFAAKRGDFAAAIALQRRNVENEPIGRDVVLGSPPLALLLHFTLLAARPEESLAVLDQLEARVAYGAILSGGYYVLTHAPEYERIRKDSAFGRAIAARLPAYAAAWSAD